MHAGKEQVSKAMKGEKAGGFFFPITAVQRWDSATGEIENGTYFGLIFALTFKGPFEVTGVGVLPLMRSNAHSCPRRLVLMQPIKCRCCELFV